MNNDLPDHPDVASALRTGYPTWVHDDGFNEFHPDCPYFGICQDLSFDGEDYADCKTYIEMLGDEEEYDERLQNHR